MECKTPHYPRIDSVVIMMVVAERKKSEDSEEKEEVRIMEILHFVVRNFVENSWNILRNFREDLWKFL